MNSYILCTRDQTLGKMAVGTKIVHRENEILSGSNILGKRYIASWLLSYTPLVGRYLAW